MKQRRNIYLTFRYGYCNVLNLMGIERFSIDFFKGSKLFYSLCEMIKEKQKKLFKKFGTGGVSFAPLQSKERINYILVDEIEGEVIK